MPSITTTDLTNAKLDVEHIAAIATSTSITATDRLNNTKDTIAGAIYKIAGITNRGAWVTATVYATKDIVTDSGTWYICVVAHTSGATFAGDSASKWRVYQGVTSGDLAADTGASLVGEKRTLTNAVATTLALWHDAQWVNAAAEFGATGNGSTDDTTAMQNAINAGRTVFVPKGNYILSSITLASGVRIVGEGRSQTTFTSKTSSGAAAMVVLPVGPVIYSGIEGVSFVGAGASNVGQHCWYFNAQPRVVSPFDGGIWYSTFRSCSITGFDGHCIWLRGGPSNFLLPIQFNTFDKIYALRADNATSRSLLMTGQVQSNTFSNECQFDGVAKGTGTNLEISREFQNGATFGGVSVGGAAVGDNAPGPNTFDEIISQNCSLAVLVDRAYNNRFNGPYFEACDKVYDQSTTAHGNVIEEPNVQNSGYDGAGGGFYFRNGTSSSMRVIGGTYSTTTLDKFAIDTSSQTGLRYDGVPKFLNNDVILAATKSDGYTTGLTSQISVSGAGALNLFTGNPGATTYLVNTSATNVTAINATVMPGSQLFLRSLGGTVTYATGGNLLLGAAASIVIGSGSVAHFVRFDLGTNWVLVSVTP